jgi:ABC-type branched-subunit amino acid transport system permease subunit
MPHDDEHLRLLSIFHYIVGGLAALFSFFPLIYAAFGGFMLYASAHPHMQQGEPPPPFLGWIFISIGCFLFLIGETLATCIILAGRFIARRRHYWFAFVTACVQCLFFPFGIILGVFTIIVLSRSSVKQLFGVESHVTPTA